MEDVSHALWPTRARSVKCVSSSEMRPNKRQRRSIPPCNGGFLLSMRHQSAGPGNTSPESECAGQYSPYNALQHDGDRAWNLGTYQHSLTLQQPHPHDNGHIPYYSRPPPSPYTQNSMYFRNSRNLHANIFNSQSPDALRTGVPDIQQNRTNMTQSHVMGIASPTSVYTAHPSGQYNTSSYGISYGSLRTTDVPPPPPHTIQQPDARLHRDWITKQQGNAVFSNTHNSARNCIHSSTSTLLNEHVLATMPAGIQNWEDMESHLAPPPPPPPHPLSNLLPLTHQRFEEAVNIEMILYDDVIYHIISFLSFENKSSCMSVSKKFNKNGGNARKNTESLVIKCDTRHRDYVSSVVGNCKKLKGVYVVPPNTLSLEQIKTIITAHADTIGTIFIDSSVCLYSPRYGDRMFPIKCDTSFLCFLASTVSNLNAIGYYGCIQENDLLEFAQRSFSLEKVYLCLGRQGWHDVANKKSVLDGIMTIIQQNQQHLEELAVLYFDGFGDVLLKGPECPALKKLYVYTCDTSPIVKGKIAAKFPHLEVFACCENPVPECAFAV